MASGRTTKKHLRVYVDQYADWNNDIFAIGPLVHEFDAPMGAAFADEIKNAVGGVGQARISAGVLQGYLHAGAGNFHNEAQPLVAGTDDSRIVTVAFGIRAAPVAGDPVFASVLRGGAYQSMDLPGDGIVAARLPLEAYAAGAESNSIDRPWGILLDTGLVARSAVNTTDDVHDHGAQTTTGAIGILHVLATDSGARTILIEDSGNGTDWATLMTFDTDGDTLEAEVQYVAGTVEQYTRWQIADGASGVTFVLSIVRGIST